MPRVADMKHRVNVATGREVADLLIRNCRIVDVFNKNVFEGNVAVAGNKIAGFVPDDARGRTEIDAKGSYLVPGLINGHVHIESSHCSPEEYARLVVPCGTTTAIADPHEICNVCGIPGLDYMLDASEDIGMDVYFMFPSCVPATEFEHAGATLTHEDVKARITNRRVLGLGELMNVPGVCNNSTMVLEKIAACDRAGKHVDGHSPAIRPDEIDAYTSCGIITDHESETGEELQEKVRRGIWVMLREGSSCKNLIALSKGLTPDNMNHCLLCTDDKHPKSILAEGDIDHNVRLLIQEGIDPLDAIRMGTINAALCHRLHDRGAIAPGYQADFFLVDDLKEFKPRMVFTRGRKVAEDGKMLYEGRRYPIYTVDSRMHVKPLTEESFDIPLHSDRIRCIDILPGGVVTGEHFATVKRDEKGNMLCDPDQDICKIAVVERHHATGFKFVAPIHNYGLKNGAVASTIAHDSHNLMIIGDNNADMLLAAEELIKVGGGQIIVKDGEVKEIFPHPIAGLMTDRPGEEVAHKLDSMHDVAQKELGINPEIDPLMTLCFMALPVIPQLKVTDSGLFDYLKFKFVSIEADGE